jgi:hypothetical protein
MRWNPITGHTRYEISDCGQIRKRINKANPERNKPYHYMQFEVDRDGYKRVQLDRQHFFVHRLVYQAFVGELNTSLVVCHINNDRSDNRALNLLQATQRENIFHKREHGTWQSAENHPRALLSNANARAIRRALEQAPRSKTGRLKRGEAIQIAYDFDVSIHLVHGINSKGSYSDA